MSKKIRYQPHNPRWFNRILHWTYGLWLRKNYKVQTVGSEIFKDIRPPYVLVPNHVSSFDPFLVGSIVPDPVYWITSDGNMRSSVMRILLSLVGSIPKSKTIPDMETVGTIVRVIRKQKGVVGIFAEGQAAWDGRTQAIFASTAKLLMLLKAPLIVPIIKGLYFSSPRWARKRKKGFVEIQFKLVITPDEYKSLKAEDIQKRLTEALYHDEYRWSANNSKLQWIGSGRALGIERALFMCPICKNTSSIKSNGNTVLCSSCGASALYDKKAMFRPIEDKPFFGVKNIQDWDCKQWKLLKNSLRDARDSEKLLVDNGAVLFRGKRFSPLQRLGNGSLTLFRDQLTFEDQKGTTLKFPITDIDGIGTLRSRTLEFYIGKTFYRIRFRNTSISARKWQGAVEILGEIAGLSVKDEPGRAFYCI